MSQEISTSQTFQYAPDDLIFIQSRAEINLSIVEEYAAMMAEGIVFDAVEGIKNERGQIFVWDGAHRGAAARKAGKALLVNVEPGTEIQAEWLALSANQKHGLRRSQADKQRIIRKALSHPYGVNQSDRQIARHCGVDHKTVGKIRKELELSGEIPQIDTRIVHRGGAEYKQDITNIGNNQRTYVSVRELEAAIRRWLSDTFMDREIWIQVLENIKHKTTDGHRHLEQLFTIDTLPSPNRKRDTLQACNNILEQLYAECNAAPTEWMSSESSNGWTLNDVRVVSNGRHCPKPLAACKVETTPKAQEFECPRCRREKIVGVNGSRRWCLNCGAEWPTAAGFLAEVKATGHQNIQVPSREELRERFLDILARLEEQDVQLSRIDVWLNELENRLVMPQNNNPADEIASQVTEANSMSIMEYA